MTALARKIVIDTATTEFATDVVAGLTATPKRLSPKYFYDSAGSALFERITELPEYYPTRREIGILNEHAGDIAALDSAGRGADRIRQRLEHQDADPAVDAAKTLAAYVPVDISAQFLHQQMAGLRREYPKLAMLPVAADFTKPFDLPDAAQTMPRVGFFPGSTIGNFEPHEAAAFLRHAGRILGRGATFIVGVDLVKDTQVLQKAYNDSQGVTAKFNLNLLTRINRELGAKFNLGLLRASRVLQPRALAHRDASGQPEAPAHQGVRRVHRVPRRRNHPHREQLQIFGRLVRRAGARRRLDAGGGMDRRRQLFQRPCR